MSRGRNSAVGTATRYGLDGPGIESRWGARFSTPIQTGPGVYPVLWVLGIYRGKSGRGVALTTHTI